MFIHQTVRRNRSEFKIIDKEFANRSQTEIDGTISFEYVLNEQLIEKLNKDIEL